MCSPSKRREMDVMKVCVADAGRPPSLPPPASAEARAR